MFKYKIEEWDREHPYSGTFFVAFVHGWIGWRELGRLDSKREAEELCRRHQQPRRKPWLYTAEAMMSD